MEKIKPLTFRMPHSMWTYFKKLSVDREMSLTDLMLFVLDRYKNKSERRMLTNKDTKV